VWLVNKEKMEGWEIRGKEDQLEDKDLWDLLVHREILDHLVRKEDRVK